MKKFVTILIGCSLALTVGARAEQDPKNKKKSVQKQPPVSKQHTAPNVQTMHKNPTLQNNVHKNPTLQNNVHKNPTLQNNVHKNPSLQNNVYKNPTLQNNPKVHMNNGPKQQVNTLPSVQPHNPSIQSNKLQQVQPNQFHANKNVKNFQPRHQNFHAQVNSSVASVHFNQNYRIRNAQNWHGAHYNVFRTYQPQWHDRGWWHSHHNNIVLIGGGWYFWNAGYWYPAWGYDEAASYYPYDGPIYVGNSPRPFDQVVADVQSVLQEQGYYHGEIDGLVGPLTQEALAAYQSNAGLEQTAAIDQPTLESLGVG